MDESLTSEEAGEKPAARTQTVEAGVSPADSTPAADTAATTEHAVAPEAGCGPGSATPATARGRALDLNQLQTLSSEKLAPLAPEFGLHLHPARSRHHHITDLVRAAMGRGSTVAVEGFLDQVGDSLAL